MVQCVLGSVTPLGTMNIGGHRMTGRLGLGLVGRLVGWLEMHITDEMWRMGKPLQ